MIFICIMNSWFLSTVNLPLCIFGSLFCLLGLGAIYSAWQQKCRSWPLIALGWSLWLLSVCHWALAFGADRGCFITPLILGCAALLLIISKAVWRQLQQQPPTLNRLQSSRLAQCKTQPPGQGLGRCAQALIITGLLPLTAALGLAFTLFALVDFSIVNRLVAAAFVVLVFWPVFILWSRASSKPVKPACWFTGLSGVGLLIAHLAS